MSAGSNRARSWKGDFLHINNPKSSQRAVCCTRPTITVLTALSCIHTLFQKVPSRLCLYRCDLFVEADVDSKSFPDILVFVLTCSAVIAGKRERRGQGATQDGTYPKRYAIPHYRNYLNVYRSMNSLHYIAFVSVSQPRQQTRDAPLPSY